MGTRHITETYDDIDGSPAEHRVNLTVVSPNVSGAFELDLSAENVARFEDAVAEFVAAARPVKTRPRTARAAGKRRSRDELDAIREWGRSNGFAVAPRGRLSAVLEAAYAEAHR